MNPDARGLLSYLEMLPKGLTCHWFTTSVGACHRPVSMLAAAMGGHIRTGLGDNPRLDGGQPSNPDLVRMAVEMARMAGREVATPTDARAMMGLTPPRFTP